MILLQPYPYYISNSISLRSQTCLWELNVFFKVTLPVSQMQYLKDYFWPLLACFPSPGISYGQDESNLPMNLLKGTLIELFMCRIFFSLGTKCLREVMLDEPNQDPELCYLSAADTLLTIRQWGNEDFNKVDGECRGCVQILCLLKTELWLQGYKIHRSGSPAWAAATSGRHRTEVI